MLTPMAGSQCSCCPGSCWCIPAGTVPHGMQALEESCNNIFMIKNIGLFWFSTWVAKISLALFAATFLVKPRQLVLFKGAPEILESRRQAGMQKGPAQPCPLGCCWSCFHVTQGSISPHGKAPVLPSSAPGFWNLQWLNHELVKSNYNRGILWISWSGGVRGTAHICILFLCPQIPEALKEKDKTSKMSCITNCSEAIWFYPTALVSSW